MSLINGPRYFGALMSSTHFLIAGESLLQCKTTGDQSGSLTRALSVTLCFYSQLFRPTFCGCKYVFTVFIYFLRVLSNPLDRGEHWEVILLINLLDSSERRQVETDICNELPGK